MRNDQNSLINILLTILWSLVVYTNINKYNIIIPGLMEKNKSVVCFSILFETDEAIPGNLVDGEIEPKKAEAATA